MSSAAADQPVEQMETDSVQPGIQDPAKPYTFTGRVTYATEEDATMVMRALAVDPELRPQAVRRKLSVDGATLVLNFAAIDMRTLRAAVGTFCDLLGLATRTLEAFGPAAAAAAAEAEPSAATEAAAGTAAEGLKQQQQQ
ncbi:hypothetical protein CHLNCDRAFT_144279 [Chlorella variabilis]|uniref:Pcc1-domain-containing protein n=1 Tax=Chlorella variabilis TaxID=554065 RepID=E1ZCC0_CHLVA|nr:hypothetical protein CHLNCDRAFT_144279 [Chlorella variabilis]EFN56580.1 hypothetical protein CHLNCDRAFT_144279 [Chlorella variabilis]|eukprot:XP_005848682.1 hypothetical protein CHLNCDRAFT_144279 [Chlorella variabilis]